ncbi:MAG TPA: electron transfer flavoprotein subunit alpha/FixB family protein [Chitinophagales bacterium]|nr:electron transfer flavoprotein subunit alpha/FixB family protein [Chitinophagales bacterium]HNC71821.1 electron transfer flavoprotein subunit alpha/FixB family protein [Chitinophagales bacterium]HND82663.1 electron transfer flavoprotein subunit alpha/FixB family protein [Chitinophagales bacterium]
MAILFLVEIADGKVKKASFEAASYATAYAKQTGKDAVGLALGTIDDASLSALGIYGAKKIIHANNAGFDNFDASAYAKAVAEVATQVNADTIVISQTLTGKAVAPVVSARLKAGIVSGAVGLPDADFVVKKAAFSGKAFAFVKVNTAVKVVAVVPNSFGATKGEGTATVEASTVAPAASRITVKEVTRQTGDVAPLPEAELVVSAGRGMKGPENWGIIEDLASALGATTACSRPVADVHWRPHHEHVGQTGVAIRPNLYIAIGISGAIQHLAGVNQSKCIVVINKDPEAPFFKAADYGIVGDAFEIVPKLTEAVKALKASQH